MKKTILLIMFLVMIAAAYAVDTKSDTYTFLFNFSERNTNKSLDFLVKDSITSITFLAEVNNQFEYYYPTSPNWTAVQMPGLILKTFTHNRTHLLIANGSNIVAFNKDDANDDGAIAIDIGGSLRSKMIYEFDKIIYVINNSNVANLNASIIKYNLSTDPATIEEIIRINSTTLRLGDLGGFSRDGSGNFWIGLKNNKVFLKYDSIGNLLNKYTTNYFTQSLAVIEDEIYIIELDNANVTRIYNMSGVNTRNFTDNNLAANSVVTMSYINNSLWMRSLPGGIIGYTEAGGKPRDIRGYVDSTNVYINPGGYNNESNSPFNTTSFNTLFRCSNFNGTLCDFNLTVESATMGLFNITINLTYLPYMINYDTEKILETSLQDFDITISNLTNATAIDIALFYNGTFFNIDTTTTYPSYTAFNYSFNIPRIITPDNIYNYTFYFDYNHTFPARNETRTSEIYNHSLYNLKVGNCSGFDLPSDTFALNITFYDLNEILLDTSYESTAFYGLDFDNMNQNFSFEDPNLNNISYCIYPDWASLQVNQQNRWYDGANYYDYFLFNSTFNNITQLLKLYTQNNSETTQVLFTVQDTNTDPIPNAYIHILRYNVGTGSYKVQEILKTDSQGQAIGNIVLFNDYYNFLVYFQGTLVYTEQAVKLIASSRTFTIDLEGVGWIDDFETAYGINYDLYFNNATNNFVFTWSDPTSVSHFGCLKVDVTNESGKFTLSDTCIESASGTIVYTISSYNSTTFTATGYVKFEINIVLKVIQEVFEASRKFFYREMPLFSLFIAILIVISLFLIGLPNPTIALSLMGLGMLITSILGLFTVAPIFLGGIIFLIVLQIYLGSKR